MPEIIKKVNIPLNRVEGDLEIRVDITDGVITDALSSGIMYRGFETMMMGRGCLDGLVITPRICGICSLTHLTAAARALDTIAGVNVPDNALYLRNIALMAEIIQSDLRQAILMYMVDFTNHQAYHDHHLFQEAVERYQPLKGSTAIDVIQKTRRLIEVIAIIGGQWPHTSFMVPGGVTSIPDTPKLMQCRLIIEQFKAWYESRFLGCSIEKWQQVSSLKDLDKWLEERPEHFNSEVGFFLRFALKAGLDKLGAGTENYISYGNFPFPENSVVNEMNKQNRLSNGAEQGNPCLFSSGFVRKDLMKIEPLNSGKITEDVSCAWFEQKNPVTHPFEGETRPRAEGNSGDRYSWIKAPRYDGLAAETGPLSEMIIDGVPLFHDMVKQKRSSALTRELARITRPARLLPVMNVWINELMDNRRAPFYTSVKEIPDGEAAGMIQAARGALGHWVKIKNRQIDHYQIITPTAWNGSPRDGKMNHGPWEIALKGTPVRFCENPVEAGHVIRSFDPCMVCAVHTMQKNKKKMFFNIGI